MDSASFGGTDIYVDPAAFCGVAARMLVTGGRDGVPALLALLGQALHADVRLLEVGASRSVIPKPRVRPVGPPSEPLSLVAPIDLPVRGRDSVLAVLSITAPLDGLPAAWTNPNGPLGTITDLLALALTTRVVLNRAADATATAHTWFALEEADRSQLAGGLHDGLIQSLIGSRYLLDLASSTWTGNAQPWLEAARECLQAALGDGRDLLMTVHPRTHHGRGLRSALEGLCASSSMPVELHAAVPVPAPTPTPTSLLIPVVAAASYRFAQAALTDLHARGGEAAEIRLTQDDGTLSLKVDAIGDKPAWPDEPGPGLQRWATRIELLGGSVLLQPASAYLRFAAADVNPVSPTGDVQAGRRDDHGADL